MEYTNEQIKELNQLLAKGIPEPERIKQIATYSNLPVESLKLDSSPKDQWFVLLDHAKKSQSDIIQKVIDEATEIHPQNKYLIEAQERASTYKSIYSCQKEYKKLQQEIQDLQKYISEAKKELQSLQKPYESQSSYSNEEKFEKTFFQLLHFHTKILEDLSLPSGQIFKTTGRRCFDYFYQKFLEYIKQQINGRSSNELEIKNLKYHFDVIYNQEIKKFLHHYYQNIEMILIFIDQSSISNKPFYTDIFRSQFSELEIILLFYYCFSSSSVKNLVKKLNIFKNLKVDCFPSELKYHYDLFQNS